MSDTATPSARDRVRECDEALGVIAERLAEAEAELASLSLRDPKRHTLRRRIAEMKADMEDAQAQKAKLAPAVQEEQAAEMHAFRVARHGQAMEAAEKADALARAVDVHLTKAIAHVRAYLDWVPNAAAAAGVEPHPYRLGETVPNMDHVRDVILARLVAGGILDMEFMPALYADAPAVFEDARVAGLTFPGQRVQSAVELAARATVLGVHHAFRRAIASADPDRQRREAERLAEVARQRAERERSEATKPLPKLPASPPLRHSHAIVSER
jgi:hypothetical protein